MHLSPSYPVGVSMAGLIFVALIVAFVVAAFVSRGRARSGLAWASAIVALVIASLWVVRSVSYESVRVPQTRQAEFDAVHSLSAERYASGEIGTTSMRFDREPMPWAQGEIYTRESWGGVFLLPLIPLVLFLVMRLINRKDRGEAPRSGSAWSWFAVAAACIVVFGGYFGSVRHVTIGPSPARNEVLRKFPIHPDVVTTQNTPVAASQPPMDELWDRLTAARIPVTTTSSDDHAADRSHEETAPADSGAHHEPGPGIANVEEADHDQAEEEAEDEPRETRLVSESTAVVTAEIPPPRPDWVEQRNNLVVNGVRRVVLEAGPYTQLEECHNELRRKMVEAVQSHVNALVHERTADPNAYLPPVALLGIGEAYITRELLDPDVYVEDGNASFGLTKTAWAMLEFDANDDVNLLNSWKAYARRSRISTVAAFSATGIAVLGGILALLKIDTWTRGYYTKRLFLGVPAAIIAVVVFFAAMGA